MNQINSNTPIILYIKDEATRSAVAIALDNLSLKNTLVAGSLPGVKDTLSQRPSALLILDWQGKETVNVLDYSRQGKSIDLRPIFLIVQKETEGFLNVISDYHLTGIHAGTPSSQDLHRELAQVFDGSSPSARFRGDYAKVKDALSVGNLKEALRRLLTLVEEAPNNVRLNCEIADIYFRQRKWDKAEDHIETVLLTDPKNPRALHLLARCALKKGDLQEAKKYLKRSTTLNPLHTERLLEFGETLLKLHEPKEAEKNFQKALEITPDSRRGAIGRTTSKLLQGEFKEALTLMKDVDSEQERAAIFNNSGILSVAEKEFARAHRLYDVGLGMITQKPLQARITFNKSLACFKAGERNAGLKHLNRAVELDPNFVRAKEFLEYQKNLGSDAAQSDWQRIDDELEELDVSDLDEFF